MGKRRGRRTRSDSGGRRRDLEEGFPAFRHNQWTFEGEIERLGHLARSVNRVKRAGGRRGAVSRIWVAAFVVVAALAAGGAIVGLVNLFDALL